MLLSSLLAYVKGGIVSKQRTAPLTRRPLMLTLFYLGGHPGIWNSDQPFLVGRSADQIRLVSGKGSAVFDLPIARIKGSSYDDAGLLRISYEPTHGLVTSVDFLVADDIPIQQAYSILVAMLDLDAQVH